MVDLILLCLSCFALGMGAIIWITQKRERVLFGVVMFACAVLAGPYAKEVVAAMGAL